MEFFEVLKKRKSVRKYNGQEIPEEILEKILAAGHLAPSGKNLRPVNFVVVKDRDMLDQLSRVRTAGAGMLTGAACAIVVIGDSVKADTWIEDCSIAMTCMHLCAVDCGVGSCWIQMRMRKDPQDVLADTNVKNLLGIPEQYSVEAILSLGMVDELPAGHETDDFPMQVHYGKF